MNHFAVGLVVFVGEHGGKSLVYTAVAVVPIPPDVEKTRSENEACSISLCVHGCLCT